VKLWERWLDEIQVAKGEILTKQSNPRSAKNGPTSHDKIETSVRKDSRNPKIARLGTRQNDVCSDTGFGRKTEPASRGEDVSCLGHPVLVEEFF
jgi:hypothetical protein